MKIKKVSGTAVLNGNVVDNLTGNSTTNAPSQRAVKEYVDKKVIEGANYIKFPNGTLICYGQNSATISTADWGSWKSAHADLNVQYPVPFVAMPIVTANTYGTGYAFNIHRVVTNATTLQYVEGNRPNAATSQNFNVSWIAIGRWK